MVFTIKNFKIFAFTGAIAFGATALEPAQAASSTFDSRLCADSFEKHLVRGFYEMQTPAAVTPEVSRLLSIVETKVVSALPSKEAVGTQANPEVVKSVWESIDAWGADNGTFLVLTVKGWHAYSFPTKIPVAVKPPSDTFFSVAADNGKGARVDMDLDSISLVYAVKLRAVNGNYLRTINFYDQDGDLIMALYATEPTKPVNEQVLSGFNRTWDLIDSMPSACKKA